MLGALAAIAEAPLPTLAPCDDEYFQRCLRSLSILPKRADDEVTGELRVSLYQRQLRHLPKPAMTWLVDQALTRCTFFPSIKECLEIAGEWNRPDVRVRSSIAVRVRQERLARFDELMARLTRRELTQPEIEALPDRIKAIAVERCLIWRDEDGSWTARPDWTPPDAAAQIETVEDLSAALGERFPSERSAA